MKSSEILSAESLKILDNLGVSSRILEDPLDRILKDLFYRMPEDPFDKILQDLFHRFLKDPFVEILQDSSDEILSPDRMLEDLSDGNFDIRA
jgi:hypothetical protein